MVIQLDSVIWYYGHPAKDSERNLFAAQVNPNHELSPNIDAAAERAPAIGSLGMEFCAQKSLAQEIIDAVQPVTPTEAFIDALYSESLA